MTPFSLIPTCLLACTLVASPIHDLHKVKTIVQLAKFIYRTADPKTRPVDLLEGLNSHETITIQGYSVEIPIREIFGTIVYEQYNDQLGDNFSELNKCYGVREICSFRNEYDEVYRYHIEIFEERQYSIMRAFLTSIANKSKLHSAT